MTVEQLGEMASLPPQGDDIDVSQLVEMIEPTFTVADLDKMVIGNDTSNVIQQMAFRDAKTDVGGLGKSQAVLEAEDSIQPDAPLDIGGIPVPPDPTLQAFNQARRDRAIAGAQKQGMEETRQKIAGGSLKDAFFGGIVPDTQIDKQFKETFGRRPENAERRVYRDEVDKRKAHLASAQITDYLAQAYRSGAGSIANAIPELVEGVSLAAKGLDSLLPQSAQMMDGPVEESAPYLYAQAMRDTIESYLPKPDERTEGDFWSDKVVGGMASALTMLAPGKVASAIGASQRLLLVGFAATQIASNEYRQARAAGADEETARAHAGLVGAITSPTELLGVGRGVERVLEKSGSKFIGNAIKEAIEEYGQEGFQQMFRNFSEKTFYNPDKQIMDGVAESAKEGGVVGALFSMGATVIGQRWRENVAKVRQTLEASVPPQNSSPPPMESAPAQPMPPEAPGAPSVQPESLPPQAGLAEESAAPSAVTRAIRDTKKHSPGEMSLDEFLIKRPPIEGYLYHGSPDGDVESPDSLYSTKSWIEGIGFYTTESYETAERYANGRTARGGRKTSANTKGRVNYIRLNPDAKLLDMDKPADMAMWRKIANNFGLGDPDITISDRFPKGTNGAAFEGLAHDMSTDAGMSRDEVMYALREYLEEGEGFDGTKHTEGRFKTPHTVRVLFGQEYVDQSGETQSTYKFDIVPPEQLWRSEVLKWSDENARKSRQLKSENVQRKLVPQKKDAEAQQITLERLRDEAAVKQMIRTNPDVVQAIVDAPETLSRSQFSQITGIDRRKLGTAEERKSAVQNVRKWAAKAAEARADLGTALEDFGKYLEGRQFANPLDPELLAHTGRIVTKFVKAGALTFAEMVESMASRIGGERTLKLMPGLVEAWESERKDNPDLEAVPDNPESLISPTEDVSGRDLAVPTKDAGVQGLYQQADEARQAAGEPVVRSDKQVAAEAEARLQQNYDAEKMRLLSKMEGFTDVDTAVGKRIIEREGIAAIQSGDASKVIEAMDIIQGYRDARTEVARSLRQGRADILDPAVRAEIQKLDDPTKVETRARLITEELLKPPEKVQKAIRKAKEQQAEEMAEEAQQAANRPKKKRKRKLADGSEIEELVDESPPKRRKRGRKPAASEGNPTTATGRVVTDAEMKWPASLIDILAQLRIMGIDISTPEKLAAVAADPKAFSDAIGVIQTTKAPFGDKLFELYRNFLLSAGVSFVRNAVSNSTHLTYLLTAERVTEALINTAMKRPEGAQWGEFKYMVQALLPTLSMASRNMMQTWRTEMSAFEMQHAADHIIADTVAGSDKMDNMGRAIGGKLGKRIRIPQRLLLASDDLNKTLAHGIQVSALAYRFAKADGLTGDALVQDMARQIADPSSEANKLAHLFAEYATFTERGGELRQKVKRVVSAARRDIPGLRYQVVFQNTPINIYVQGILDKSPIGSIPLAKRIYKGATTGEWDDITPKLAQQTLAWAMVLALLGDDEKDPLITGAAKAGNTDERESSYAVNLPPMTVGLFGTRLSYAAIEPYATGFALAADIVSGIRQGGGKSITAPFESLTNQTMDKTFMSGLGDIIEVAQARDKPEAAGRWASRFGASWIPNIHRSTSRATRDSMSERGVWGKGIDWWKMLALRTAQQAELPFVEDIPKVDVWGRTVEADSGPFPDKPATEFLWRALSPSRMYEKDVFVADRIVANWNLQNPDDTRYVRTPKKSFVDGRGKSYYFTPKQYEEFLRESGSRAATRIERAIGTNQTVIDKPTPRVMDFIADVVREERTKVRKRHARRWIEEQSAE